MTTNKPNGLSIAALVIALLALAVAGSTAFRPTSLQPAAREQTSPLLQSMERNRVIRAGYGVFPPFTQEDPRTGKVSGVSVEILEEIARQSGVRVEWKRFNWNTMAADLKRGEFDVVADPIFQTPQRGRELTFSEPYSYFPIGIGIVRRGENRFAKFSDINRPDIRVAVGQGFAEEAFVRARAPRARILAVPANQDTATPMNSVLTGRADIAIVNLSDAERFVAAHAATLEMLWADSPPAQVPAGFAIVVGDFAGANFLDASLRNLDSTGVVQAIAARHGAAGNTRPPGQGPR